VCTDATSNNSQAMEGIAGGRGEYAGILADRGFLPAAYARALQRGGGGGGGNSGGGGGATDAFKAAGGPDQYSGK
jgi:hypothetical protein